MKRILPIFLTLLLLVIPLVSCGDRHKNTEEGTKLYPNQTEEKASETGEDQKEEEGKAPASGTPTTTTEKPPAVGNIPLTGNPNTSTTTKPSTTTKKDTSKTENPGDTTETPDTSSEKKPVVTPETSDKPTEIIPGIPGGIELPPVALQ